MSAPYQYQALEPLIKGQGPREKMLEHGPSVLKDYEHLAVIFGTGYKKESVLELATRILADYGDKAILKIKSVQDVIATVGLPTVKACQLLSVLELGRRLFAPDFSDFPVVRSPEDAYRIFQPLAKLKKETLEAIYLNAHHQVIHCEIVSVGSVDRTPADPGEVFLPAIGCRAAAVIVAHNHPSGDLEPSAQDLKNTRRLREAGKILGKPLLDHLIIGKNDFRSVV